MGLIFRCRHYDENRHHDESEHNDGRVSPLVNKGEPLFANKLQSLNQGSKSCSCSDYLRTAKSWVDTLADIGKSMDDDDLISFIINGLNHTNNSFITSYTLATRANPLSFTDFHDEVVEP
jgi:hypothetical protein